MSGTRDDDRGLGDLAVYCLWVAEAQAEDDVDDTTLSLTSLYRHLISLGWVPSPRVATLLRLQERIRDEAAGRDGAADARDTAAVGGSLGELHGTDLRLAQALADAATVAVIQDRDTTDKDLLIEQLQNALDSRVILEQAKGILSHSGDIDMPAAFAALHDYARAHNMKLSELARSLVNRTLPADLVLDHASTRGGIDS